MTKRVLIKKRAGRKRFWTPAKIDQLRELVKIMPMEKISKEFDRFTTTATIRTQCYKNGIKIPVEMHAYEDRKLNPEKVLIIRKELEEGKLNQYELAAKWDVTQTTIYMIKVRKIWKNV